MPDQSMEMLRQSSHLAGGSDYIEALYEQYLLDPNSITDDWREVFNKLAPVNDQVTRDVPHSVLRNQFLLLSKAKQKLTTATAPPSLSSEHERKQVHATQLARTYRVRGHQKAKLDPLGLMERQQVPDLELSYHSLTQADMDTAFLCDTLYIGKQEATLAEIIDAMEQTYCASVGAEINHIVNTTERRWIQQRLESVRSKPLYSTENRLHILERLAAAEGLEKHLGSKYPGTKRFGLEGGESLIPLVDEVIQRAGSCGTQEVVIGMAHRGRLNVLVNILGKNPTELFGEFEGKSILQKGSGDVKYHQGFSSNVMTPGGEVHLALAFNPSHLEIVSPVAEGSVRARQDRRDDTNGDQVLAIIMHGDAAFAGQGVVMETLQMSQTRAYKTGGTVHIIINNQVGFTTSRQDDSRSTEYCTDIAKMVQAPIFHVNADDPEAVIFVAQLAVDYRKLYKKDVVIDLICYRRLGHNEADEPSGTQPLMYQKIRQHPSVFTQYSQHLIAQGVLDEAAANRYMSEYREALDKGEHVVKSLVKEPNRTLFVDWSPYLNQPVVDEFDTTQPLKHLQELAVRINTLPEGFPLQRQVQKIIEDRLQMASGALPINWGFAETLAYASILHQGIGVRMTGQDCGRGTFSHRHAVLHNQKTGDTYTPLQELVSGSSTQMTIYDSFLSEEAVLAFEYGYATTSPNTLVIWEAQFGDFANGAQVVIDQFITSGEHKWGRLCGLVMLLPHGYEGNGPEHSSARLERFMQLCAEHNIQVCAPTTPAQVYHMLRRQACRTLRKPLVVMSPKSLLRHKDAVSSIDDLAQGTFQSVIGEQDTSIDAALVQRVVLCSGKVYYDLLEKRREEGIANVALVRIEQLYPFPEDKLFDALSQFPQLEDVVWCQEEPMNQGAWFSSQHHMRHVVERVNSGIYLSYAGRDASAAPAAGYMALHVQQLKGFLQDAMIYPKH